MLLRDAGLGLAAISKALAEDGGTEAEVVALEAHVARLHEEQAAIQRKISAVVHTLEMRRQGRQPRMDMMLEGFNDRYEDEVSHRWGREVFEQSNCWWHAKSLDQQRAFQAAGEQLLARWGELFRSGVAPDSPEAQAHAERHAAWFAQIPGTPGHAGDVERTRAMLVGMANLYSTNADFHPAFGGAEEASFAATALRAFADA